MINLSVSKVADASYLFLECRNKIRYTVIISNKGTTDAYSVTLKDILGSNELKINKDSILVDGCFEEITIDGIIQIGTIKAGGNSIIVYDVCIPNYYSENNVSNKVVINYCESLNPLCEKNSIESDLLVIPVVNINVKVKKMADKDIACLNEEIDYMILVRNDSLINLDNVILNDVLSDSLEICTATVLINSNQEYLEDLENLNLGTINADSGILIQFKAKLISIPVDKIIRNKVFIKFNYSIEVNGVKFESAGTACSNEVIIKTNNICDCC
ncbi:MAG: hypothetical protein ACRCTZ_11100 [Sarcina sp.]